MDEKIHEAFAVHMLNDAGKAKAREISQRFNTLLAHMEPIGVDGRHLAIVTTKLEEACFFAKKSIASKAANVVGLLLVLLLPGLVFAQDIPAPPAPAAAPGSQTILELVLQYVVAPLLPVIGGLLVFALKKLTEYLTAKSAESKGALVGAKLTGAAASAVAEINATLRPQLEAALADGKLTDTEKAALKAEALKLLKEKLPAELLGAASGIFGGFLDTYLGGLIEREVLAQKATAAIAAQAAPVPPTP